MNTQHTVLVIADHDTAPHATVALFEGEGLHVNRACGEDNVTSCLSSMKPSLMAYRLADAATKRPVCRKTLQAVSDLPGPRTPSLALCEVSEVNAAAALCKEGLADDYLVISHLKDDPDRVTTTVERLIALKQRRERDAVETLVMEQLWATFMQLDLDLQDELHRVYGDVDGRASHLLGLVRAAHHRAKSRLSSAQVLVVDDDPDFQALLVTLVGAMNHPVVGVSNAADALKWLEKSEPALILLDHQMPDQDGVSILKIIRKSTRLKSTPVIMLTGHSRLDTVQRVKKLGVVDFIVKPSELPTIMKKIAAYL